MTYFQDVVIIPILYQYSGILSEKQDIVEGPRMDPQTETVCNKCLLSVQSSIDFGVGKVFS